MTFLYFSCRFCLKQLNIHKRNFNIDDNISKLFYTVTGIELNQTRNLPKITCELCIRSLQHFSSLKEVLVENQFTLLRAKNNSNSYVNNIVEEDPIDIEPEIEYRNFDDSDEDPFESPVKKIKIERQSPLALTSNNFDPSASELLDELLPVAPDQECMYCNQKLPNTHALKIHIKSLHQDQDIVNQMIRCPIRNCQSSFKRMSSFVEHKKLHQFEGSIRCEICGKICISKDQLRAHMKYHQQPKYKCNECDITFFESQQLKTHQLVKHENIRNFKCPNCEKTYSKRSHLSRHVKVSHEKQTINCNIPNCKRVYTRRERVIIHIARQHPEISSDDQIAYIESIKNTPYTYSISISDDPASNVESQNNSMANATTSNDVQEDDNDEEENSTTN